MSARPSLKRGHPWLLMLAVVLGAVVGGVAVGALIGGLVGELTYQPCNGLGYDPNCLDFGRGFEVAMDAGIGLVIGAVAGLVWGLWRCLRNRRSVSTARSSG